MPCSQIIQSQHLVSTSKQTAIQHRCQHEWRSQRLRVADKQNSAKAGAPWSHVVTCPHTYLLQHEVVFSSLQGKCKLFKRHRVAIIHVNERQEQESMVRGNRRFSLQQRQDA